MTKNTRGVARPGKTLEPLSLKIVRVRLLAMSYLDAAVEPGGQVLDTLIHGDAEAKAPRRNDELWNAGSYARLEKALDELRLHRTGTLRGLADCVWSVYVCGSRRHLLRRAPKAQQGLLWLCNRLSEPVLVPPEIALAAGYAPADAASFAPLWAKERAA